MDVNQLPRVWYRKRGQCWGHRHVGGELEGKLMTSGWSGRRPRDQEVKEVRRKRKAL